MDISRICIRRCCLIWVLFLVFTGPFCLSNVWRTPGYRDTNLLIWGSTMIYREEKNPVNRDSFYGCILSTNMTAKNPWWLPFTLIQRGKHVPGISFITICRGHFSESSCRQCIGPMGNGYSPLWKFAGCRWIGIGRSRFPVQTGICIIIHLQKNHGRPRPHYFFALWGLENQKWNDCRISNQSPGLLPWIRSVNPHPLSQSSQRLITRLQDCWLPLNFWNDNNNPVIMTRVDYL